MTSEAGCPLDRFTFVIEPLAESQSSLKLKCARCPPSFTTLPSDLLQTILSFLAIGQVLCKVQVLSQYLRQFVMDQWFPTSLSLSAEWFQQARLRKVNGWDHGSSQHEEECRFPVDECTKSFEEHPTIGQAVAVNNVQIMEGDVRLPTWGLKTRCLRDPDRVERILNSVGSVHGLHELDEGNQKFPVLPDTDSPLSLLRAIAQDTFFYLAPTSSPITTSCYPQWLFRSLDRLEKCEYLPGRRKDAQSFSCLPRQGDQGRVNEHLSLLDAMQILFASARSIREFAIDCSPQFSSFILGPHIPRCPSSLLLHKQLASFLPGHEGPAAESGVHWSCWTELLSQSCLFNQNTSDFSKLQTLSIAGSYLPATLAVLSLKAYTIFPAVSKLELKGAIAAGRYGMEAFEKARFLVDCQTGNQNVQSEMSSIQNFLISQPGIQDLVACLLFASNPFRSLAGLPRDQEETFRANFWADRLVKLFGRHTFPHLRHLDLKIGSGTLERRLWWSVLLNDLFLASSLRILEFDCSVESLTCFLPSADSAQASDLTSRIVPSITRVRGSADWRHLFRAPLSETLLHPPQRFPELECFWLNSSYSVSEIVRLQDFIDQHLENKKIIVQVRVLHLFVNANYFEEQVTLFQNWEDFQKRRIGSTDKCVCLFPPPPASRCLSLDFSLTFPLAQSEALVPPATPPPFFSSGDRSSVYRFPGIQRLNLIKFSPFRDDHRAMLAKIRFPSLDNCLATSLEHVCAKFMNPENLIGAGLNSDGKLRFDHQGMWDHPDIIRANEIHVFPTGINVYNDE